MSTVAVTIVNYNHRHYLPSCLEALRGQTLQPHEVIVVDNASHDGSAHWLRAHAPDVRLIANRDNRGYAGGHNQAIACTRSDFVLALNCDVTLAPDFLEVMRGAMQMDSTAGSACGRLYRGQAGDCARLDSTGLYPDRFRRFHDRDHDVPDDGQRTLPEYVFGVSGAAAFFRRAMLDDVALDGQCFDEMFFAYCEDADLAWRAQRRGWNCRFVPDARGWHVHDDLSRARSTRRDEQALLRQMLLARNRHLCFLKNERWVDLARALPRLLAYDLALQGYLAGTRPRLAARWPMSLARLLPDVGRKRAVVFASARRDVRLADWFDSDIFHAAPPVVGDKRSFEPHRRRDPEVRTERYTD